MTLILEKPEITFYKDTKSVVSVFDTQYKTFKRVVVSRTIDGVCGEFTIIMSRPAGGVIPFKSGDVLDIRLDGQQVMRGKIYSINPEGDALHDFIVMSGRDITGDLIDSTVPDDSKVYTAGVSIFDIANKIIQSKGMSDEIKVIDRAGGIAPFETTEIVTCNIGNTVIGFLQKYSRKRQLFINTSRRGDLVFFKAAGETTGNRIINQFKNNDNNVIEYKAKFDIADRYFKYICKTQKSDAWASGEVDSTGEALDTEISKFREKEFKLEEGFSGSEECAERAIEEANVRRARSFEYTVTVQGFRDKQLWNVNQFVDVADDRAGVNGVFFIKGVEYIVDSIKGAVTKLTITYKDAYTAEASLSLRDKDESKLSWYNEATVTDSLKIILGDSND